MTIEKHSTQEAKCANDTDNLFTIIGSTNIPSDSEIQESISKIFSLTKTQQRVLKYIIEGLSNKEISNKLSVQEGTIKMHCASIFKCLEVNNRTQAAILGYLAILNYKQ